MTQAQRLPQFTLLAGIAFIVFGICITGKALSAAVLLAGIAVAATGLGFFVEAWRRQGLRHTGVKLLEEVYFPFLRWILVFLVLSRVFFLAGLTEQSYGLRTFVAAVFKAACMMEAEYGKVPVTLNYFQYFLAGTILYILVETAIRKTHPKAQDLAVRVGTLGVLGVSAWLTLWSLSLIACYWISFAFFIGLGGLAASRKEMFLLNTAKDELWIRPALVVLAFYPLAFYGLRLMGLSLSEGHGLLFALAGLALPLLWYWAYRMAEKHFGFDLSYGRLLRYDNLLLAARTLLRGIGIAALYLWKGTRAASVGVYRGARAVCRAIWRSVLRFWAGIKAIISASSPEDE